MSRERLAALAGLSARTIYNLENGLCEPRDVTKIAIARVLGRDVEEVFTTNEQRQAVGPGVAKTTAEQGRHGTAY